MTDAIFKTYAPAFWEAGYSVIPVLPGTKQPAISGWPGYCDNLPSEKNKREWLLQHGLCGVGLALGGKFADNFRLAAIDIDRDELVKPVSALIKSPSGKVGKKGVTLFVRIPIEESLKSGSIPGVNGPAGDLLMGAKMTVLPPSIHPDTGEPYCWVGAPLLETPFETLPILDRRLFGVLARLCTSPHLADLQRGEVTHSAALSLVAQLVSAKATDEEIVAIVTGSLPEGYSGDTLDELAEMTRSAREKGFGDPTPEEDDDPNLSGKLVKLCLRKGFELFHDGNAAFASVPVQQGGWLKAGISDALCIIATGGGIATRKLYTDEELAVTSAARPTILNGISGFVKRPDLLERSIYVSLDTMPVEKRRTEEEMKAEFMAKRPAILAGLYNLVSHALANLEKTPAPIGVRMADAARFIAAAEGGLDVESGTLISIISGSQDVLMIERINEEPLTLALRHVLQSGPFEGTVGQLFEKISCLREIPNLPRTTAQLSATIERLKPSLLKVGIRAQMLSRSRAGKKVRIEYTDPDADSTQQPPSDHMPY